MSTQREQLIRGAVADAALPDATASVFLSECPWLDGTDEISQEIGTELLADVCTPSPLATSELRRFVEAYNERVRNIVNPLASVQSEAYSAVRSALRPYGREDPFGEGDYWVVSDSFSSKRPRVILFNAYTFPPQALGALKAIISQHSSVFSALELTTEENSVVLTISAQ